MRKITISILAVILSMVTFSTVTYAWLSLASSNTIENISLSFSGESALEISLDGINYYNKLPGSIVEDVFGKNKLVDVSSVDGRVFTTLYDGGRAPIKNKEYLQVTFYFRSHNVGLFDVYLVEHYKQAIYGGNNRGTYVVSQGQNWISNISFNYGVNTLNHPELINSGYNGKYYLSEAIRVSFNEEHLDLDDLRSSEELRNTIFDFSKDPSRSFGKPYGAYDYFTISNSLMPLPTVIPNVVTTLSILEDGYTTDDISKIATLQYRDTINGYHYSYGKVTMSIWIEGWDPDAFDAVLRDKVSVGLQFNLGALRS